MRDNYLQDWNSEIENSSRARTYILFCSFGLNSYFKCVKIEKFKFALYRFRVSVHILAVEAGIWHKPNKIPYNERKCQLCNTLEDEFHFLLECPLYYDLRKLLIDKYYWTHPIMIKLIDLLRSENENTFRKLSTCIHKGFELRTRIYDFN